MKAIGAEATSTKGEVPGGTFQARAKIWTGPLPTLRLSQARRPSTPPATLTSDALPSSAPRTSKNSMFRTSLVPSACRVTMPETVAFAAGAVTRTVSCPVPASHPASAAAAASASESSLLGAMQPGTSQSPVAAADQRSIPRQDRWPRANTVRVAGAESSDESRSSSPPRRGRCRNPHTAREKASLSAARRPDAGSSMHPSGAGPASLTAPDVSRARSDRRDRGAERRSRARCRAGRCENHGRGTRSTRRAPRAHSRCRVRRCNRRRA